MAEMFDLNDKQIHKFERDLRLFAKKALPFATRNTINTAAFTAQKFAKLNVQEDMVNRNKFTVQSIRVEDEKRELNISRQEARVGSTADYMEDQEFGSTKSKKGKHGVPIATGYSAGQEGQQPRTRLPSKSNKLQNIRLRKKKRRPKNRGQAIIFKAQDAVTSGQRYVFLDLGGRSRGIFKVVGGRKDFKRGWPKGAKLKMVWSLKHEAIHIPKSPWLKPAVDDVKPLMPLFYRKALEFQLRKNNLFN